MIKGSQLVGRAVIDMDAAERLGRIKEIIVQRDGERVAGFIAVHGQTIVGTGGTRRIIPASALHSIGPDAITVRGSAMKERIADFDNLPRMSDVVGHKMVTRSGRLLGSIDDVLINGADGRIIGFSVGGGVRNKLENFLNPQRSQVHGYVRADADLQVGNELIVVPDDALIEGQPNAQGGDDKTPPQKTDELKSRDWGDHPSAHSSSRSSIWKRRTDAAKHGASQTAVDVRTESATAGTAEDSRGIRLVEPRLRTETARPVENTGSAAPENAARETSPSNTRGEAATTTPQD